MCALFPGIAKPLQQFLAVKKTIDYLALVTMVHKKFTVQLVLFPCTFPYSSPRGRNHRAVSYVEWIDLFRQTRNHMTCSIAEQWPLVNPPVKLLYLFRSRQPVCPAGVAES